MKYFKNVNQTLTSGNGNPRNKSFRVLEIVINNGYAIDRGNQVDFYNNLMKFECTKNHSGRYFEGIVGKEIKKVTFKIHEKAAKKRLQKFQDKIAKKENERIEKLRIEGKIWDLKVSEKEKLLPERIIEVKSKILEIENIIKLIDQRLRGDKTNNETCNKAVGIVGYGFAKYLGWMKVLTEIYLNI